MYPIITKNNDLNAVLTSLKEYLSKGRIIKDIHVVDSSDEQVVIVVSEREISEERVRDFWDGYLAGMKNTL